MLKSIAIILGVVLTTYGAEISSSYAHLEKQTHFQPELKTEPIGKVTYKRDAVEPERHPVFNPEDYKNERQPKIEPVKPTGPVVKHDRMLGDQPADVSTEVNRIDHPVVQEYGFVPASDIGYPDVPYAPGYGYNSYANSYDMYGNSPSPYYVEPDTSPFSLLWSQVPDSRTIVSYVSRSISWMFGSIFMLFLGSLITVGVCTYTNFCAITFNGIGPIHEEMRSLITPEKLDKISNAAQFVKTAIDKYQDIQTISGVEAVRRRRRAILH